MYVYALVIVNITCNQLFTIYSSIINSWCKTANNVIKYLHKDALYFVHSNEYTYVYNLAT